VVELRNEGVSGIGGSEDVALGYQVKGIRREAW
jgi:hypothetical protein